ncbi:MAG TPA: hypothetical protein VGQ83_00360 [Polyangia bacterium]
MRRGALIALLLAGLAAPGRARAAPLHAEAAVVVGQAAPGAPFREGPLEALLAGGPRLAVVVLAREDGRRVVVADDEVAPLVLAGRPVPVAIRRPFSALGAAAVRWSVVEPHAWREEGRPARNGVRARYHSNVSVEPATFGRWLGYDEITYFETIVAPWAEAASARVRPASARPPRAAEDVHGGLGTMRYRVEVRLPGGRVLATPGASDVDTYGIRPTVFRVSLRRDDTFLGHLSAYFLVPEVFGSAGAGANHQTERFTGADCADVLTGALRRMGHTRVWHTNVANLGKYAAPVAAPVQIAEDGRPAAPIRGVRPGDLIRIRYGAPGDFLTRRGWDHVAVLWEDRSDPAGPAQGGPDGQLDGFDLVVHMGHPRLEVEPLQRQLPARIDVLRWGTRSPQLTRRGR